MLKLFSSKPKKNVYGWFGDYQSWAEVTAAAGGYDAANILNKTKDALLCVKKGTAVYERDSMLFDKISYPFPLLSTLLRSATLLKRPLHIIDFGGSLGSTYFQVKEFIGPETCASWNIIEQEHYVTCGKEFFEEGQLQFYKTIEDCLKDKHVDFILLSSSVQYLPEPAVFLSKLASYNFDFIVFDRTAFHHGAKDRLTLQTVPPEIYTASYPAWFFNEQQFLHHFTSSYRLFCEFPSYVEGEATMYIDQQPLGFNKGFYLINSSLYA
jgi:putative methyltransferase (TIGR04325 family)